MSFIWRFLLMQTHVLLQSRLIIGQIFQRDLINFRAGGGEYFCKPLYPDMLCSWLINVTFLPRRLRNRFPWLGQRWKPGSPRRLSLGDGRGRGAGRTRGKSDRPPVFDAKLLLHLVTPLHLWPQTNSAAVYKRSSKQTDKASLKAQRVCPTKPAGSLIPQSHTSLRQSRSCRNTAI